MQLYDLGPEGPTALEETLGYLNFSQGAVDPRFRKNVNDLSARLVAAGEQAPWQALNRLLVHTLRQLSNSNPTFRQTDQAEAVLELAFQQVLPAYRAYHADLLFHQTDAELFGPLFLCRVFEAVLRQGPAWHETDRIVAAAVSSLNDFLGYRPVPVLQTPQKIEPYQHEWICPIPLYFADVGVGVGQYAELLAKTLELLTQTDTDIRDAAWFDPRLLQELALDPRAYDFDHPVNKRPNYHFGLWDPHQIDQRGFYRRFVLQEVTLGAIYERVEQTPDLDRDELLFEAAAVLAGTILMASATSGNAPDCHDSGVTLASLLPHIAGFRDAFYTRLLAQVQGPHGDRLRTEAATLRQPFGGARQHLNQRLARLRATQLQHVHLAQLFARMGYPEASTRQAHVVPVASARMLCEINGQLTAAHGDLDRNQSDAAIARLAQIEDLLDRAIGCGAVVDPWNILGFQGQFSLFPALQDTVRDHRVDVLLHVMAQLFALYVRQAGEAAAIGRADLVERLDGRLARRAAWWDQFASSEIAGFQVVLGSEAVESARQVAEALGAWHSAGEAAGDVAFWRQRVESFKSAKTYALVVEVLLARRDFVAAMALLMQWLSEHDTVSLDDDEFSFHRLSMRWMTELWARPADSAAGDEATLLPAERAWELSRKFFDFFEANAEEYWEVPRFEWQRALADHLNQLDEDEFDALFGEEEEDDEEVDTFGAAYEDVVYRDSTRDGVEGSTLNEGEDAADLELELESERLSMRLAVLVTISRLWRQASLSSGEQASAELARRAETLSAWHDRACVNRERLLELLDAVHRHPLTPPRGTHDSLVDYDRRRQMKEALLGRIMVTSVEMADAARLMLALGRVEPPADLPRWESLAVAALADMYAGEADRLRGNFATLRAELDRQAILYVPLAKGGDPRQIVAAQSVQQVLAQFLRGLPRLGLLAETCQLIATAQAMERHRPVGEGAVTEFDRLFEIGYLAIVESLIEVDNAELVAAPPPADATPAGEDDEEVFGAELIECLQTLTESLLKRWHGHSRNLRLSVLEKVSDKKRWQALVTFIQDYGHDLFTPRFLNFGNLRGILHQRVDTWLDSLTEEDGHPEVHFHLLDTLDQQISREEAVEHLTVVIEAVLENYGEFKDFNSTTTQSDRGELLYMLLDFLRLKVSYERFAWNIKPVVMAHEVLVRRGKTAAAELWRRAVAERTAEVADWHLAKQRELSAQYGMRLPTVSDLLEERFVRPLAVDLLRALVRPAIDEVRSGAPPVAFHLLEQEIGEFTESPTGAGLDVPAWLVALEQEAGMAAWRADEMERDDDILPTLAQRRLTWSQVIEQLQSWDENEA